MRATLPTGTRKEPPRAPCANLRVGRARRRPGGRGPANTPLGSAAATYPRGVRVVAWLDVRVAAWRQRAGDVSSLCPTDQGRLERMRRWTV